jgi:hypothetical protein
VQLFRIELMDPQWLVAVRWTLAAVCFALAGLAATAVSAYSLGDEGVRLRAWLRRI